MSSNDVTSRFLKSIDKYARMQQSKIEEEIQAIEKSELERSEVRIIEDINSMIQKELMNMKNKISIDISHKELECRKDVSKKRQNMLNQIFEICREKLIAYTNTSEYVEKLKENTKKISQVLDENDVKLFVKEEDIKYKDIIEETFDGFCEVCTDSDIKIGGIRGYSKKLGIISDETLDSSLDKQRDWFIEKYGSELVY